MRSLQTCCLGVICLSLLALTGCTPTNYRPSSGDGVYMPERFKSDYSDRVPQSINTNGEKVVLVDPKTHAWGAYDREGNLVKSGVATAGGDWCPDDNAACRTNVGTFRIRSLGDASCKSRVYPKPKGGGLMPYCMFFSGGQALHGSPDITVVDENVSHGCVRMRIQDAEWVRNNFATVGTKVRVEPYE